jgi:F-type H+-transporting ATPase subunit gamma
MAGSNLRDIRRRIRSIENTRKITQAMKMVSAAKLRRAQEQAEAARPYAEAMADVLRAVAAGAGPVDLPLLTVRPVQRIGYVVLTADRGLAGPYNASVLRRALLDMPREKEKVAVIAVGRKARDFFRFRRYPIVSEFLMIGDSPRYFQAQAIAREVVERFVAGEVDEVRLVYAQFVTAMTNRPVVQELLPLKRPEAGERHEGAQYLFEPDAETVLERLLPQYVESLIFRALLEAKASEHGARMTAMDAATKNSGELIRYLTLLRNRLRQAAITKEIAEIVGGAAALE